MKKLILVVFAAVICFAGVSYAGDAKAPEATKEAPKAKPIKGEITKIDKEKLEITIKTGKGEKDEKVVKVEAKVLETLKVGDKVTVNAKGKVEVHKDAKKKEEPKK